MQRLNRSMHFNAIQKPRRIVLGQKDVFKRKNGSLRAVQVNDEAYYISVLESLEQLLNDEFILEQVCEKVTFSQKTPHGNMQDNFVGFCFANHDPNARVNSKVG